MAKVVLIGGAGFIGSHVAKKFLENDHHVYIYDAFKSYRIPSAAQADASSLSRLSNYGARLDITRGNFLNLDHLRRYLSKVKPSVLVHLGALSIPAIAIEDPEEALQSIVMGTTRCLDALRELSGHCRLTYISSSMVYGDFESDPIHEESKKNPLDIYGSMKYAAEIIAHSYGRCYKLPVCTVRLSTVYGPYDTQQRVLFKFISAALQSKPIQVKTNSDSKLDFTYVEDAAQGIYLASTQASAINHTFNITFGKAYTFASVIELLQKRFIDLRVEYLNPGGHEPVRGTLDITRAKNLLGFQPQFDLPSGLDCYIEHLRRNPV